MLVKIVSAAKPSFWYSNMIGHIINVQNHDNYHYIEKDDTLKKIIKKNDCVIIDNQKINNQENNIKHQFQKNTKFASFLKQHDPEYVPDWNTTDPKYFVYFSHEYKCWSIGQDIINDTNQVYMPFEICQKLVNKLNFKEIQI